MRYTKEKLYELVPAVYRQRDTELGKPLERLLAIIAEQVQIVEKDIEDLYENWFIETSDEWVVSYIGDLVGTRSLATTEFESTEKLKTILGQRAWVANTIRYRRSKGTAFVLEQMAQDVTGWKAKVVEFFQLLSTTQYLNHLRLDNHRTPDLRNVEMLELLDGPFDSISHTLDVRSIKKRRGLYNIQNIGLFLWRLQAYPVNFAPCFSHGDGRYSFSQIGLDIPLFNSPLTEVGITHLADQLNVPEPIRRLRLKRHLIDYYGIGKSILLIVNGLPVEPDDIIVCNLEGWRHRPPAEKVAVDPLLGRIAFPAGSNPTDVHVNYYYGFSTDSGGGFYDREGLDHGLPDNTRTFNITKEAGAAGAFRTISDAISQWSREGKPSAIFEILDSEFYGESFDLVVPENVTVVIQSSNNQRPVLRAADANNSGSRDPITIRGQAASRVILDGLFIDKSLYLNIAEGDLSLLNINHCTLVPCIHSSLLMPTGRINANLTIELHHSITGRISLDDSEARLIVKDSILDGQLGKQDPAIKCYSADIENTTVFGAVAVTLLNASNTIFTEKVTAERRQMGCLRFSFVSVDSEVPRRYRCCPADDVDPDRIPSLKPRFTSTQYGDPGYAQLHKEVAVEIFEGADDGAEMGAFHSLYQPQRIRNLESSLDEYLRFGLEAGILLVDVSLVEKRNGVL
jgi:hypothetical protein